MQPLYVGKVTFLLKPWLWATLKLQSIKYTFICTSPSVTLDPNLIVIQAVFYTILTHTTAARAARFSLTSHKCWSHRSKWKKYLFWFTSYTVGHCATIKIAVKKSEWTPLKVNENWTEQPLLPRIPNRKYLLVQKKNKNKKYKSHPTSID